MTSMLQVPFVSQDGTLLTAGVSRLRVAEVRDVSDCVRSFRLVAPTSERLPSWRPGAHLELVLPSGLVRHYSLCGDPGYETEYEIAVLREPQSRGGSAEMHDHVRAGDELTLRGQRNHFGLDPASAYLFIAGGVGITPILPMVRAAARQGARWRLVYGGRSRSSMAFLDRIAVYGHQAVDVVPQDERGLPELAREIRAVSGDTLIYACGPEGLLQAVESACADAGRSDSLRLERFAASGEPSPVGQDTAFEVELRSSGQVVAVPVGTTILEAVRTVLPGTLSSCEEGFCGTCETRILDGTPEHRDTVLSDEERAANETMMICVSRAACPRLVLDM